MAKRKAARSTGRKTTRGGSRTGSTARKSTARKTGATAGKSASRKGSAARRAGGRKTAKKAAASRARTGGARKATRKTAPGRSTARKAPAARKTAGSGTAGARRPAARKAPASRTIPARKAPDLNRPRRRIDESDLVPTPPSSLDLDRSASATRSGRRELRERYSDHTETSPALTGGDVDADWESAYSVGDEAPGGDNPTPDQDIVDDIGRAVGVEYQDNEELKGADKVARRDRNRWELDPASSEDWDER